MDWILVPHSQRPATQLCERFGPRVMTCVALPACAGISRESHACVFVAGAGASYESISLHSASLLFCCVVCSWLCFATCSAVAAAFGGILQRIVTVALASRGGVHAMCDFVCQSACLPVAT
jgi:hypothetical protein